MPAQPAQPGIQNKCRQFLRRHRLLRYFVILTFLCLFSICALFFAVHFAPFDDTRLRHLDVSTVITDRDGRFLRAYLSRDDRWRIPVKLSQVSPWMVKSTIATEDKRYFHHHGIDMRAVARAFLANLKAGRIVSGASTISMQVAGFAIDSRDRTIVRKIRQAFLALQIEAHWTKQQILECYLTHASYGGNVCGVEAAARRYFNKTAAELSVGEAALLAGIPQSPERFRPDTHLAAATRRREYVLGRLLDNKQITSSDYKRIKKLKVATGTYEVPIEAPHFCDVLHGMYPAETRLVTTLQTEIQHMAEATLREAVRKNRAAGVSNGAVLVISNQTAEILAMVGSVDYWNRFDQGQVNAALGFRSPGSTLKPFIYGQAMDAGLLEPDEMLYDVPVTISGYSPVNFDREFRGPVPAAKALAWSLNIPAIEVLKRVGVGEFRNYLQANGLPVKINAVGDPGLSMAIGTCSVRLLDLAMAYSSMAVGGDVRRPDWLKTGKAKQPTGNRRWLSPAASSAILSILSDDNVRAPEDVDLQLSGMKGIAWKTGTSNGFRDAWTFAVTRNYTIGVWMGNMNGQASRALVGGKIAAPVALGLAQSLAAKSGGRLQLHDNGMELADACLQTGLSPSPDCADFTKARFLKRPGQARVCHVHRKIEVDAGTGFELCTRCNAGHTQNSTTCAIYPSEVASWFRANHHPWAENLRPAHNPDCKAAAEGEPPTIVSPASACEIVYLDEIPADFQKIALTARTDDPGSQLFWFVDGNLAGSVPAWDALRIKPVEGRHTIKCVDARGRASESWFSVENSNKISSKASKQN